MQHQRLISEIETENKITARVLDLVSISPYFIWDREINENSKLLQLKSYATSTGIEASQFLQTLCFLFGIKLDNNRFFDFSPSQKRANEYHMIICIGQLNEQNIKRMEDNKTRHLLAVVHHFNKTICWPGSLYGKWELTNKNEFIFIRDKNADFAMVKTKLLEWLTQSNHFDATVKQQLPRLLTTTTKHNFKLTMTPALLHFMHAANLFIYSKQEAETTAVPANPSHPRE